ncbi:hypothetical protein [Microcoleus sp. D3_18_C4]|uniref:hypothetical protein n=1 Tax=Microcoleus sp. D3_18_C4 TaxID=3055335 RepID=UPI002FD6CD14
MQPVEEIDAGSDLSLSYDRHVEQSHLTQGRRKTVFGFFRCMLAVRLRSNVLVA